MTSKQKLCPQCIVLYAAAERLCPSCNIALIDVAPTPAAPTPAAPTPAAPTTPAPTTPAANKSQAHSRASAGTNPSYTESTSPSLPKPITYSCPYCEGNILNEFAIICPNCNRTLPQNWRDWTNSHRSKLQPPTPTNTPVVGSMPSGDP
jgi:RNA polymerase subunit RPABC4/transcription elongation factor Spt4